MRHLPERKAGGKRLTSALWSAGLGDVKEGPHI